MATSPSRSILSRGSDPIRRGTREVPPWSFFVGSAVFHYLGPAFAVLLFARVDVLGVAWLRIASAGAVFALWRRPWRAWSRAPRHERTTVVAQGLVLAAMNACFYLAIEQVPLGTVAAIEFVGPVVLAVVGVAVLAGVGVGVCSSVIPYVLDQLAMRRMSRAAYSLLVSLLPATATVIGIIVLAQVPTMVEVGGVALVIAGVAAHRDGAGQAAAREDGGVPVRVPDPTAASSAAQRAVDR